MTQVTAQQFYEICEASLKYFAENNKPQTEEEVELQTMENWWDEFKQYMEDNQ